MVRISLFDNKSHVFFNTTLFGLLFAFNGKSYSSVNDCFNSNKFINHWNPNTIPSQHRVMLCADGFLYEGNNKCFSRSNMDKNAFELYVKSYLFCKYYEQISGIVKEEELFKYCEAYQACSFVVSNIYVEKESVNLVRYGTKIDSREIVLYINKDIKSLKLDEVNTVHISVKSLSKLSNPKKLITSNCNTTFNIYVEDPEDEVSYILFLCRDFNNVIMNRSSIPTGIGLKVVSIGAMKSDVVIDWSNFILLNEGK